MPGDKQLSEAAAVQQKSLLPAGTIIRSGQNKAYIVEGMLGQGGFSSVYLVREQCSGQHRFALKEISTAGSQEQRNLSFEAEVLMRLQHPSLPHIYEVFADTSCHHTYLLMDYIAGKDLETLRTEQAQKRYPLILVIVLMSPIVEAISYLHAQTPPIVHRDIKPANIIVPDTGQDAFLVDFGLAKEYVKDKTTNIFRGGTPGYAAPEQYGQGTSPQTDVYGLAATIYTLLTGNVPPAAIMRSFNKRGDDPLKCASQLNPTIPAAIDTILTRALSLQAEQRYAAVNDFWQEFTMVAEIYAMGGNKTTASALRMITTPGASLEQPTTPFPTQPVTPFPTEAASISSIALEPPARRSRWSTSLIMTWGMLILIVLSIAVGGLAWLMSRLHDTPSALSSRHQASLALSDSCIPSYHRTSGIAGQQVSICSSPNDTTSAPTGSVPLAASPSSTTSYPTPAPTGSTPAVANHASSTTYATPTPVTPTPATSFAVTPTPTAATANPAPAYAEATPTAVPATPTPSSKSHSSPIISINLPLLP
jgi:serine/threonine protein kinase